MTVLRNVGLGSITVAVVVGLVAQAGSHLLAFTTPAAAPRAAHAASSPYADPGVHAVGVRTLGPGEAPMPLTVWYPALEPPVSHSSSTYAYAINMLGADSATAIATYHAEAEPGADFDLVAGPFPLVILSHGFSIAATSYGWLAEHVASHGMVVVAPHHSESLDPGVLWRATHERPRDVGTVLSFVDGAARAGGKFEGLIDRERVAVVATPMAVTPHWPRPARGSTPTASTQPATRRTPPMIRWCSCVMRWALGFR